MYIDHFYSCSSIYFYLLFSFFVIYIACEQERLTRVEPLVENVMTISNKLCQHSDDISRINGLHTALQSGIGILST